MAPSSSTISSPNAATTARQPSLPGRYTSCAAVSASITAAPRSASRPATNDFPLPMPPVRPITRPTIAPYARAMCARLICATEVQPINAMVRYISAASNSIA